MHGAQEVMRELVRELLCLMPVLVQHGDHECGHLGGGGIITKLCHLFFGSCFVVIVGGRRWDLEGSFKFTDRVIYS